MQFIYYKDGQKYTVSNAIFEGNIEAEDAMSHLELNTLQISGENYDDEISEDLFAKEDGISLKKEIIN
jgi:hypothetical protein